MREKLVFTAALTIAIGCSSSAPAPATVYGEWIYTNTTQGTGFGLSTRSDGTYEASLLSLTGSSSANAEVETGAFFTSGSTITFMPQRWSCRGTYPTYSETFTLAQGKLTLSGPTSITVLVPNPSTLDTSFTIEIGCFNTSGAFAASPLGPIAACGEAGATCGGSVACCGSMTCIDVNGGTCAAICTLDSQCASGCCAPISTGAFKACSASAAACVDAGQ